MPDIPTEAVEAAAGLLCDNAADPCPMCVNKAKALLAAALPHLPQHVSPSVEQIEEAVSSARNSWSGSYTGSMDAAVARAVLALFSSQSTVEQVRRETLLSAADEMESRGVLWVNTDSDQYEGSRTFYARWLRARAAEVGETP